MCLCGKKIKNESFKKTSIVLTNEPHLFNNVRTVHYVNKVFSYFDKLLFSLRLVEKYKTDVLYIDSDWIQNVNDVFIKNFHGSNNVLYYDNWENDLFINYINDFYWKDLLFYFNLY